MEYESGCVSYEEADVVVIGAGPAGLAAAISALNAGASVTVVEENDDIGGHGMVSGGTLHLGGGHRLQQQQGIVDSAELVFSDWVRHDAIESRFCDRDLVRVFADSNVAAFDFLVENGVEFLPHTVELRLDVDSVGPQSVPRLFRCREWPNPTQVVVRDSGRNGSGLVRPLERSARQKGATFLLRHKMTGLDRSRAGGPMDLVDCASERGTRRLRARGGIVLATGGSSGNVALRRVFDPRLTEEYQHAGAPYSFQTGDGEMAAMAFGAALWCTAAQTAGTCLTLTKTWHIGCRWGYRGLKFRPDSPCFSRARATGLTVTDWQNVILVKRNGKRFWNESDSGQGFFDAALAYCEGGTSLNGGGPIWAIFDQDAVEREDWDPRPPNVDPDYFARGSSFEELTANIRNPYQHGPMDGAALKQTVERYNGFVAAGVDGDFGRPQPRYMIRRAPFFAAWATPILHDSLSGLRIDRNAAVLDLEGRHIRGLFCAGETHGGFPQHGMARAIVFGRIAGANAASSLHVACSDKLGGRRQYTRN